MTTQPTPPKTKNAANKIVHFFTHTLPQAINYLTLVLSLGLLAFVSWATFRNFDYLANARYMEYQLIVCLVFLAEYFYRLIISKHRLRFLFFAFPFLIISIPYLNIIEYYNIPIDADLLYYIRLIPVFRGLVALVMVVNYVTRDKSTTVFASYALVLIPIVYMSSLVFYTAEKSINSGVKNFWYALWWAGMNVTTIGCNINPVTATGMVIGFILSLLGIIMLPLFTVYFGDMIGSYTKKSSTPQA